MVPCVVPYELKNLSFFEKLLISRINPIMSVVTIENRNLKIKKFKGHTHHKHFTRHHKNCNHPAKTSRRSQNNLDQKEDTERGQIQTIQNKQGENSERHYNGSNYTTLITETSRSTYQGSRIYQHKNILTKSNQ